MIRTVLITGAAGGIGRAATALFADKGWRVLGVDRAPFGAAFPQNGLFIQSDISHPEELTAIFERVRAFTNSLHALVNNAAVQVAKPLI
jgi:NAD(P)-dependent dehydrogenase (short-subunit alcohol dehydrogenase family)